MRYEESLQADGDAEDTAYLGPLRVYRKRKPTVAWFAVILGAEECQ